MGLGSTSRSLGGSTFTSIPLSRSRLTSLPCRFERQLEALRKELAETKSLAASSAASPATSPDQLPTIPLDADNQLQMRHLDEGMSVSEAGSEMSDSPILVGGPGKDMDLSPGFKLDPSAPGLENRKDR